MLVNALVLFGGQPVEKAFKRFKDVSIKYVGRFNMYSLGLYDVVIIPYYLDQVFLRRHQGRLTRYVRQGGILVLLGATEGTRAWLPLISWERDFTTTLLLHKGSRCRISLRRN